MLSNLETSTEKLIQLVLVGQPELDLLFNRHELRQVRDRIALRARIAPLTIAESVEYIEHRLNSVSRNPQSIFSKQALDLIVKTANGLPRRLNILCDNALITGFGCQETRISAKIAKEVIADLNGHVFQFMGRIQPRYAVVIVSVALPIIFYLFVHYSAIPDGTVSSSDKTESSSGHFEIPLAHATPPASEIERPQARMTEFAEKMQMNDLSMSARMELSETARLSGSFGFWEGSSLDRVQPTINNPRA